MKVLSVSQRREAGSFISVMVLEAKGGETFHFVLNEIETKRFAIFVKSTEENYRHEITFNE